VRTVALAAALLLAAACKDKPRHHPPATLAPVPGAAAAGVSDLVLPAGDGKPPRRTTRPLGRADFERLVTHVFAGFESTVLEMGEHVLELRHVTKDRRRFEVRVKLAPCFDCLPMELATWQARTDELAVYLGSLRDEPGVELEVGQLLLHGQPVIYHHQVGSIPGPDGDGSATHRFTNGVFAYYNDGVNAVVVAVEDIDVPADKASLLRRAPKDDLQVLALAFLDYYTSVWP
jgi:hypothetical protein